MTLAGWSLVGGLDPTPPQARDWLRQELQGPEYQSPWLDSVLRWFADQIRRLFEGAGHLAGLSPLITVLMAVVVIALLVWILPRVRRERGLAGSGRAVLDWFRAIAKDMSDRRVLDDAPGRTAHEVSLALASTFPDHADRLALAADLFDSVRYGHRRASASLAGQIQELDAELVSAHPLLMAHLPQRAPV